MKEDNIPLITITGPTAIGKTALGVQVGRACHGEIISADSRQFYRHMDIGTAKPTADELAAVPHHLIGIAEPHETVGLAQFLQLARTAITDIAGRGGIPLVVGGTGQYVKALLQGWQVPEVAPNPQLRADLEARAAANPDALWAELINLDPDAQEFIDPRNIRRVVRALEVCLLSGRPYSELRQRITPPYRILHIGLTAERQWLYGRADRRVELMMEAGLLAEVTLLLEMGCGWSLPAMSGLGYSQFQPYFEGNCGLDDVVERIKLDTHDFIRRQYTWFRPSNKGIHWFDVREEPYVASVHELVMEFLSDD
ncbi:MAG: tRNA (adenosine(37)-N6)-dimethylallyltransferase MiaA [Anaerolineae bacterium]|nr:tRNA (adenosine(37)-N6)-dimethylallyltransferase MiaA [Anaerolineae bacterium]